MLTFVERLGAMLRESNFELADELFAPDFIAHLPLMPILDREGWIASVSGFSSRMSNLVQEVHEVIISEDWLVLRITYAGMYTDSLFGMTATLTPVTADAISIFRFSPVGQVGESWIILDGIGLLAQIRAAQVRQYSRGR